jgi:argininosuccinate lyase
MPAHDPSPPADTAQAPDTATPVPLDGTWSGRFGEPMSARMQRFNASVDFDQRLARADIAGSRAHTRMLAAQRILSADDLADIERGLGVIEREIAAGEFVWQRALEDVHFNIERRLTALVGDAGKRLHTARSRNDQVATDIRLWLREAIDALSAQLIAMRVALQDLAERHADTIMPGFTHLQVAQPVTFGHHLMAYDAMLARDVERLRDCRRRVNRLPLGSAALAGTSFPIDRERVARELGFEGVSTNSLDAVSDRDFAIEFEAAAALVMVHLSRFAEELVLWSTPRFGFVSLADRFCTGSSIMPQKKNPDVPELVRGKSARVIGHLTALLVLMKGQPLAYSRTTRGQGTAVDRSTRWSTVGVYDRPRCQRTDAERRAHARSRARRSRDGDRLPTISCARALRFAMRTKPSHARCAPRRPAVAISPRCRSRTCDSSRR